jgi:hypothetical protein
VPADLKVCIHACSLCRVVIVNARVELQIFILKQETMGQLLTAKTTMPEMIECLSQAEEFLDFKPRNDQKKILEDANKVRSATDGLHPCPVKVVDLIRNVEHSCTYQKCAEGRCCALPHPKESQHRLRFCRVYCYWTGHYHITASRDAPTRR